MKTLFRKLEYQELSKINIDGLILDLGGTKNADYHKLINGNNEFKVVNIDEKYGYDFKFNLEDRFELENESFDAVLCLNVLEHIFNYQNVVSESYRILKKDGLLFGAVPFLFNIHPCPNDYFRYTKQALNKIFTNAGFKDIQIIELGSGLFSVLYQLKFGLYKFDFIRRVASFKIIFDKIFKKIRPNNYLTEKNMPLGYFFVIKK